MNHRASFLWQAENKPVTYIETVEVQDGVRCDVYQFSGDSTKDLGIIRVSAGSKTPLQRILKGAHTIQGFMSGSGTLAVTGEDSSVDTYNYPSDSSPREVDVHVGQTMQWHANTDLVYYEICEPPYEDGRYENLPE